MPHHPIHTPYDGTSKPFTIGLKPLDPAEWIEIDATFDAQLREKRRLYADIPDKVFVAEDDTADAQGEVLALLLDHLPRRFPDRYRQTCKGVVVSGHPALGTAEMRALPPLRAASLLVQEDLILMRRDDSGWRLVAGALCFPSSWSLLEKFGRPLQDIHQPVPGFGPGTRSADLINRMFDNLKVEQPVERMNWSIQDGGGLYRPVSERDHGGPHAPTRFPDGVAAAFIRVERQTLRRLPASGDILFTIRIHLDPLAVLQRHPDRAGLAASFAGLLAALDAEQLAYKGMTADRDLLIGHLRELAQG